MEFKELKIENLELVIEMYVDAFNGEPWNDKWTKESAYKRLLSMIKSDGAFGLICLENNKILGMALGQKEYYYDCNHFNLKEICVNKSIKSKGVGSKVLEELFKRLKEMEVNKVNLFTLKNESTLAFYNKLGFDLEDQIVFLNKEI